MKGLIISNYQIGHNQYKIDRFKEEAINLGVSLDVISNDGTLFTIDKGLVKENIPECDFIIYLDKDIYLAYALEQAGYKLYNSADFIRLCDDKALTVARCSNLGIDMPKTITPPLVYSNEIDPKLFKTFLDHVEKELTYPLVGKLSYSSLGQGVYKIHNREQLESFYLTNFKVPFLFQESVETSFGRSVRVIIINEEIVGAIERINEKDYRSNVGENYSKIFEFDEKYLTFAKNIAKTLHIKYAGIDLLHGENGPLLCEINSNAFFEEFEKTTHINVAYKFLSYIVNDVEKAGL